MLTKRQLAECWQAYKTHRDEASQEALVKAYLPLVKRTVARIKPMLPPSVEEDDLISYGLIGLLEAMDRFDQHRGVPFEAFAVQRIRGAILDGLRSMGWLPRSAYHRAKQLQDTIESLEQRLGHAPSEQELAQELCLSDDEYAHFVVESAPVTVLPLEEIMPLMERMDDGHFAEEQRRRELVEVLARAIERLPERERLVITLYFYEQLTLKEIAQILKLTEGRVCQLKAQALARLRVALKRAGW
ncbi:RNA polymerase sigma-D factor [bacterium HR17]|jgi:RNA polymerase sigma factor for flagellar operon FliA|uniref:RNA polymerase sigma-D factor n=1 Tax=Candidatus Fervidibacter japonicus TaxID=2035412 RepID=A0A2H5XCV5_9BACT|nr:RNA polymerase sigma-D factor [bacterium HR17]